MDLRTMLLENRAAAAVTEHGEQAVRDELDEMTFDNLADKALLAADALKYHDLARTAATVVVNGNYSDAAKKLAEKYVR